MKKLTALFFAIIVFLQINTVRLQAESTDSKRLIITISNIDTSPFYRQSPLFSTEIRVDGRASSSIKIIGEKWKRPEEFIISSRNIPLDAGKYSYELKIRSDGTLSFNNDPEVLYQGIDGHYQLDYRIDETDNHIMIVTGLFENIITESPALNILPSRGKNWVLANVSDDSYFYQLNLRTKEGFTFTNNLSFLFDSRPNVYSLSYMYELLNNAHALRVNGSVGSNFAYAAGLFLKGQSTDDISDRIGDYHEQINAILRNNSDLLSYNRERIEAITGLSTQELTSRIENIVSDYQAITDRISDNFSISDLNNRLKSGLDLFGRFH